jgi:hypothetical protein
VIMLRGTTRFALSVSSCRIVKCLSTTIEIRTRVHSHPRTVLSAMIGSMSGHISKLIAITSNARPSCAQNDGTVTRNATLFLWLLLDSFVISDTFCPAQMLISQPSLTTNSRSAASDTQRLKTNSASWMY